MVREYLKGEGFPGAEEDDGTPGAQEAIDPIRGDYLASIHRHLKRRIKELNPLYHWPRSHSFKSLMHNLMKLRLVERTGETETSDILVIQGDPPDGLSPGDLRLDPDRGFQQRYYYRLAPGAESDPAWDNPMASIRAIYGIELVVRPRVPRPAPVEEAPERAPRRPRRPRRRGAAEEAPAPVSEELQQVHQQLELRRLGLQEQARYAAQSGGVVEIFETLEQDIADFIEHARPYYGRFPLRDLLLDVDTLKGCSQAFARALTNERKHDALGACRRGSAVLAVDLVTPLPLPDLYPGPLPQLVEEPQEEIQEEEETPGISQGVINQVTQAWQTVADRITGYSRPNSTNAERLLDRFVQEMSDLPLAPLGVTEDNLNAVIDPVRDMLRTYQEIERSDYDSSEEYQEARADAWQEFLDSFGEVDFSELAEE